MSIIMNMLLFALFGVFAQNLVFASGVGAERTLRIRPSLQHVLISSGAASFFSWIAVSGMHLIRLLQGRFPVLENLRVLLLVLVMAQVYLLIMVVANAISKSFFVFLTGALPSAVFNSIIIMAGITDQMLSLNYAQGTGYAIGTGAGFFVATVLVQEAIDDVENPTMPSAFVGLPSLLIYIGILAMAFLGFTGGPSVFL